LNTTTLSEQFPQSFTVDDAQLEVRLMTNDDKEAVLKFANALPEEDLLFLRVDLTDPAVVDDWIRSLESGDSISLVAYDDEGLVGYSTVHRNKARWTRRVGEIRVNVSGAYRSKGLGKFLTNRIFDIARHEGLKKLMANMTVDQKNAQAVFRRLGFIPEAILADYVEDRSGTSRDLVIMSYDIDGHSEQVDEPVKI